MYVLAKNFKNIKKLHFNLTTILTDEAFAHLKELSQLEEIVLRETYQITDEGLLTLAKAVPQLKKIFLIGPLPKIHGEILREMLSILPELKVFSVNRGYLEADFPLSWEYLSQALQESNLEKLEFGSGYETGAGREALSAWSEAFSSMPQLQELAIYRLNAGQANTLIETAGRSKAPIRKLMITGTSAEINQMNLQPSLTDGFFELQELYLKEWLDSSQNLNDLAKELKSLRPQLRIFVAEKEFY